MECYSQANISCIKSLIRSKSGDFMTCISILLVNFQKSIRDEEFIVSNIRCKGYNAASRSMKFPVAIMMLSTHRAGSPRRKVQLATQEEEASTKTDLYLRPASQVRYS